MQQTKVATSGGSFALRAAPHGGVAQPAGGGQIGPEDQSRLIRRPPGHPPSRLAAEHAAAESHRAGASGQESPLIRSASAKSLTVRPPAECVDKVSVTLFQLMPMSGWWFAASAR